jgi:hypothetical protein
MTRVLAFGTQYVHGRRRRAGAGEAPPPALQRVACLRTYCEHARRALADGIWSLLRTRYSVVRACGPVSRSTKAAARDGDGDGDHCRGPGSLSPSRLE